MRFLVNRIPLKMRKATNNTNYVAVEFVVCLFFALDSRTDIFRICRRKTFCHVRAFVYSSFLPFFYITRITSLYENTYENENNTTVVLSSTLTAIVTKIKLVTIKQ